MKKIIKIMSCFLLLSALILTMSGCSSFESSMSYTYQVNTGDVINIKLNTADGYDLSSDTPFVISKDGEELSQGTFIQSDEYDQYVAAAEADEKAEILKKGTKSGCTYVMWSYDNTEYNYVLMVKGSSTAVLIGNAVSEESAKECFDRLEVSVVK